MTMITPQLSHTALLVSTFLLAGTAPDERTNRLLMALAEDLADGMDSDDVRDAYEAAKVMLTAPPPDPATRVDLPPPTGGPLTVYTLDITIIDSDDTAEHAGWRFVHLTEAGAIEQLHAKLTQLGVDPQTAHDGETQLEGFRGNEFFGNDVYEWGLDMISWGINRTTVGR